MLRVLVQFMWLSQNTTNRETDKEMPLAVLDVGRPINAKVLASEDGLLTF